ncbi:ISLre2 family transposase, partial [Lactobacillus helveticus]
TYDLSDTLIISNADGGAGYAKKDFDEIVGRCKQHEHFLDVFHLNKKIKDRLGFMPAMPSKLKGAVRASLRKTHEAHLGIHHGAIESLTEGHSYLNDFSRKLSQINI